MDLPVSDERPYYSAERDLSFPHPIYVTVVISPTSRRARFAK